MANDLPVGVGDNFFGTKDTPLVIAHAALLANDSDFDGGPLVVADVTNAIRCTVAITGSDVTFTPDAGIMGSASFSYLLGDGFDLVPVSVVVVVGAG